MKPTAPLRNKSHVFATTPWISSSCPASLVRFASSRLRTPAVKLFNASRGFSLSLSLSLSLGEEVYPMNSEITSAQLSPGVLYAGAKSKALSLIIILGALIAVFVNVRRVQVL